MSDENRLRNISMLWLTATTGFGLATFVLMIFGSWTAWAAFFSIGVASSIVAVIKMRQERRHD